MSDSINLASAVESLWTALSTAPHRTKHPFRTPSLATVNASNEPQVRTVVLRAFDKDERRLVFHTDEASEKCEALAHNPVASICFWDARRRLQIRATGNASVRSGKEDHMWASMQPMARKLYGISPTPGTAIVRSDDFEFQEPYRFAILECEIRVIDALWLSRPKHRRLRLQWENDGWQGSWVVP